MRQIIEKRKRIKKKIHDDLSNFKEESQNYIKDVIKMVNSKVGLENLCALIVFGSQIPKNRKRGELSKISDCDILIIVQNSIEKHTFKSLERFIIPLERKYGFQESKERSKTILNRILIIFQKTTGMFVSHFITNIHSWNRKRFYKVFSVNKVFSYLLAPRNIVFQSVLSNSKVLYKDECINDLGKNFEYNPKVLDMVKSLSLNLFLILGSIFLIPFSTKSIKYLLESVKWSLKAASCYIFEDSESLPIIINRFLSIEHSEPNRIKSSQYFAKFIKLRNQPILSFNFIIESLYMILKIHLQGISYRKIMSKLDNIYKKH